MSQETAAVWQQLLDIMARLRAADGCPWDREQTHQSLKRSLVEESYEVLDAIDAADDRGLCEELGDLLLQVVFHAQIAAEEGRFMIDDVVAGINEKMLRRHPHVFGDARADDVAQVLNQWEAIKAEEKKGADQKRHIMQVNDNLPALLLAQKVQDKAARVGFDWQDISGPWNKVYEELAELKEAQSPAAQEDELGDVFFALVNLARFLNVDAEDSARQASKKFMARFNHIEAALDARGQDWSQSSLAELDALWEEAKQQGL